MQNYRNVAGTDINTLWNLEDAFDFVPQWSSHFSDKRGNYSDDDEDQSKALVPAKFKPKTKRLAITAAEDSNDSMPELQSVSNSSDGEGEDSEEESDDEDEDDEDDEESVYDEEREDEIRDMLREAMDMGHESEWMHSVNVPAEIDPLLEERKGNPFIKLLGSLRGTSYSFGFEFLLTLVDKAECFHQTPNCKLLPERSLLCPRLGGHSEPLALAYLSQCQLENRLHRPQKVSCSMRLQYNSDLYLK